MYNVWKREIEFEEFIRDTVSKVKQSSVALYMNVVIVESYFEFITRVLLEQFELSEEEEKKWKQSVAIDQLAGKTHNIFDQHDKKIFHAVRKLRNKVVHDITFRPDLEILQKFMKKCFNKELDPEDKHMCQSSCEKLERTFCHQIVIAYAKMANKYKKLVNKKIINYLEQRE